MGVPFDVPESAASGSAGMPRQSILQALARAYMARERQRLGIGAEERAARESDTGDLVKRAQLAKLAQEMGFAPAEQEQRARLTEAQIRNLDEPNRLAAAPKPGTPHYTTNEAGEVTAVVQQPDGSFKQIPLGRIGQRPADIRPDAGGGGAAPGRLSPIVDKDGNVIGTFHNVTGKFTPAGATPGEPVKLGGVSARKSPLPATMQQTQGMAATVSENIAKMEQLADEVVTGPIAGRLSQASQAIRGPHGPEGDFDFLGKAVVDTVYVKSGKQINENEMAILKQMIPTRARGNLPHQVQLFKQYANGLLRQYGIHDDTGGGMPQPDTGNPRVINFDAQGNEIQ